MIIKVLKCIIASGTGLAIFNELENIRKNNI